MNNSAASRGSTPSNTASTSGSCSENASRRLSLDILEHSIEDVLCCLSEKGLRCKVLESGMKLKDIVQPLSSDFSKFFECISDGAKTISDQKSSSSKLSSEAQSAALDAVKVLGNVHWVAVGLLAIANVLERFEKISANDRDCMDLLKAMLDLAKFLKQLKDMNAEIHKEISEKMMEALRLIVTGSILCRSFTRHKKMLKFLYTAKIRDELVYIRRKVDGIIGQLSLQLQLKIASSYMSQQPQYTVSGEIQNACEIEISPAESDNDRTPQELELSKSNSIHDVLSEQNFSGDKTPQRHMLVRIFPRLCSYLQKLRHREFQGREKDTRTRSALKLCHRHRKFQGREKYTRTRSALQLCQSHLLSFNGTLDAFRIPMQFTVEELERATEKFRLSVASDFYSESWKGTLSNGKQVMVKRMRNDKALEKTDTEMLVNELTCMLNFFHRNILKLVGYCITEKEETLLVYDYMPNGNLGHFLFGTDCMKSGILDWSTRVQIATGTARGIQYLHEECSVQILHCDIKPQNILLDNIYNPKISEFGLAELLMEEQTPTITRARGTMGYIAPEWFKNMPITAKVDVYSFGVMLLEIICCRKTLALDVPEVEIILFDWIYKCLKDGALNKLVEQQQAEGITIDSSQLERMVLVGLWCIQEDPILRPSMKRVVQMLEGTVDIAVPPTCTHF